MPRRRPASFGDYVRERREEKGLTIGKAARKWKIHINTLSNLENGMTQRPDLDTFIKLGNVLDFDFNEVMIYFGAREPQDGVSSAIQSRPVLFAHFEFIRHLSDRAVKRLTAVAQSLEEVG